MPVELTKTRERWRAVLTEVRNRWPYWAVTVLALSGLGAAIYLPWRYLGAEDALLAPITANCDSSDRLGGR